MWLGVESNHRHTEFQHVALPTELPQPLDLNTEYLSSPIRFKSFIKIGKLFQNKKYL